MSSSSSSSSSSAEFSRPCPKNGLYDVFLSFRGKDTRYGFTANLYRLLRESGVYTFMDINLTGEDIDYLFKMVAKSRMAVVIYSQTFASSDWCLSELEMIMQRRKEKKMLMIPIFYKVDVHELKHLSGKTVEYLDKHIQEHDETTVKKWKDAITNLGKVSGLSYKDIQGRYEYDFITDVIAAIKEKLGEYEDSNDFGNQGDKMIEQDSVAYDIVISNYFRNQRNDTVTSIDLHPTKPWVLLCWNSETVTIWNHETRAEEKSFNVSTAYTRSAKFVPKRHWIVIGDTSGFVRVFDYNTSERVKEFEAHKSMIYCIAVHPTSPFFLTASADELIKLWNWENKWVCYHTFVGHKGTVFNIEFNPKDPNSFASVSEDGKIKIWNLHSPIEKFTIVEHTTALCCVEYFVGNDDKLYLLSGSVYKLVHVWDYETRTLVKTLEGHTSFILATLVHPKLPIIITTSYDDTVCIWNKNTYRLKFVWNCDLGKVWTIGFINSTNEVILGCNNGMIVMKIVETGTRSD